METIVYGVDPGLVHTGVVKLWINPMRRSVTVSATVVSGTDAATVARVIGPGKHHVFIEGYKPRSHYDTDNKMVAAVVELHAAIKGSKVLLNHGVKKIIRRPLMEMLGVWNFAQPTHHQDLRAAARIALLGMVKNEELNELLTQIVFDHTIGKTWHVLV